ncbi:MAG: metal ABC transporter substrate-binding protein [Actinomycetota bacterium]
MTNIRGRATRRASALLLAVALVACGGAASDEAANDTVADATATSSTPVAPELSVAVSFYPVEEIVARVGGDRVAIVRLVEPGDNAHEAELTAKTVERLGESSAVFYLSGGFQPAVEKAVDALPSSVRAVDLFESDGIDHISAEKTHDDDHDHDHDHAHGSDDPHIWLDPANMAAMARVAAEALTDLDPGGASVYSANAGAYIAELDALGGEIDAALATCATRTLVTAHDAFGYLARRASLETVSVAGLNPADEPSARQLERIATAAAAASVRTVFFEVSLPEDLARTVADSIGADVDTLDALEGVTRQTLADGGTYASIMRGNLSRIADALGCS